jgi:hypothetical protein
MVDEMFFEKYDAGRPCVSDHSGMTEKVGNEHADRPVSWKPIFRTTAQDPRDVAASAA